ncbi:putative pinoresinol-lariciresinol reductase 3 [Paramyrothecium foliicola]|nr:putative pinoresinol-lariciresinol reductase 3 [Paramyrothecium foliicola]
MLVLIAGISGQLGQLLASVAIGRGLSVRGLGRDESKLDASLSSKLESFVKSENYYDIAALDTAVKGVEAVICAYAPQPIMDLDAHLLLLRAAERAGIRIFVASCWNNDWTRLRFGDFEHYDSHIAFEHHVAMTSSIRPVYIFTGIFANYLLSFFGPGGFDNSGGTPKMQYWGNGDTAKHPWTDLEDVANWTIEILCTGKGVQDGAGGYFKVRTGECSVRELAAAYKNVTGTEVEILRKGSLEDLQALVDKEREEKGRARYFEYMPLAAALMVGKGMWEVADPLVIDDGREPKTLEGVIKAALA